MSPGNQLLSRLLETGRLHAQLSTVQLRRGQTLVVCDELAEYVYFPVSAVVSMLQETEIGVTVEIASVGCEGMVGLTALLGIGFSAEGAVAVIAGKAIAVELGKVRQASLAIAAHAQIDRYTRAYIQQLFISAACNASHSVEQRLVRWLLFASRTAGQELSITHAALAGIFGLRRATITETADRLRAAGLIDYGRGSIRIADYGGLQQRACACDAKIERLQREASSGVVDFTTREHLKQLALGSRQLAAKVRPSQRYASALVQRGSELRLRSQMLLGKGRTLVQQGNGTVAPAAQRPVLLPEPDASIDADPTGANPAG